MSIVLDGTTGVTTPGLSSTGTITPGQTTGIVGTTTNNNAQAGSVGEYVASVITTYTNFPATGVFGDLTSISLTAGDWDVSLSFGAYISASSNAKEIISFIGTVSGNNTINYVPNDNGQYLGFTRSSTSPNEAFIVVPAYRVSISSTATYYLKMYADYTSGGPPIAKGRISARRVR